MRSFPMLGRSLHWVVQVIALWLLCLSPVSADVRHWNIDTPNFGWRIAEGALFLVDESGKLSLDQVLQKESQESFQPVRGSAINFGYSGNAYWIRVPVKNNLDSAQTLFASMDYSLMDEVDFYWMQSGEVAQHSAMGDHRPLPPQNYTVPHYIDKFELNSGEAVTLYLRIKGDNALSVPLSLLSQKALVKKVSDFRNIEGAFYGLAIGLLCYNLFLMVMLRERIYLEYVIFVTVHVFFQLFISGYAKFIFTEYPFIYERGVYLFGISSGIILVQFSRSYLHLKEDAPRLDLLLKFYLGISVVALVIESIAPVSVANKVNMAAIFSGCIMLFIVGFYRMFSGYKSARFYLVGQGAVVGSVMFTALASRHLVGGYEFAPMVLKAGAVAELLFFSIGLADRINRFKENEAQLNAKAAKADAENEARKRYIDQINSINKELENAVKSRSEFLANMSHEIRTPMNGILGMLELVSVDKMDMVEKNYIEIAKRSGKTLLDLINDILDLSKIEAGKLELEDGSVSLRELLADLKHLYEHQLKEKGLELKLSVDDELPECVVADRTRLWQILTNLTSNAIKFTSHGYVSIKLKRYQQDGGDYIYFSVKDSGIGIPEDKQEKIFESFTQADGSTTREYGGTGLGLTISRKLIEGMGGALSLDSTPGIGSKFHFSLALREAKVAPTKVAVSPENHAGASQDHLRILLVEDNVVNQKVAIGMLKKLGVTDVEVADNGADAVAAIEREHFDLVLMDVQMPVMDGFVATTKVREAERKFDRERQPIVAMTAHAMEGDKEMCIEAGMDDYVAKPIQKDELQGMLNRYCLQAQSSDSDEQKTA